MPGRSAFRTVQDQKLLMRINPDSWHAIALHTVTYGERVASEYVGQQGHGLVAALGNVHPHQCFVPLEKGCHLVRRVALDRPAGQRQDPDHGHTINLDLKEARSSLPLSEQRVKMSP
jgi:hypothetical protein